MTEALLTKSAVRDRPWPKIQREGCGATAPPTCPSLQTHISQIMYFHVLITVRSMLTFQEMANYGTILPIDENILAAKSEQAARRALEVYKQKAMQSLKGKFPLFVVYYTIYF